MGGIPIIRGHGQIHMDEKGKGSGTPLVSVVIATYRRPAELKRALESVDQQTYKNLEVIIVDDNGPSNFQKITDEIVQVISINPPIKYIKHEVNKGYAAARNTGIKSASGEFIAFLDDDDEWDSEKTEKQLDVLARKTPEYGGFVYCRSMNLRNDGAPYFIEPKGGKSGWVSDKLLMNNFIGASSKVIFRKCALEAVNGLDEGLPTRADHDLFIRVAKRYPLLLVDEPLVSFMIEGDRITKDIKKKTAGWAEFYKKWEQEIYKDKKTKKAVLTQMHFELSKLFYINREWALSRQHAVALIRSNGFFWKGYALFLLSLTRVRVPLQ